MANYSSNITEALNTAMANITAYNSSSSNASSLLNTANNNTSSNNSSALIRPMDWVQTNNCLCEAGEVCTRPLKYKLPPVCSHPEIGVNWQQYIRQPPVQQHSYRLEFGILIVLQLLIIGLLFVAIWKIKKGRPMRRRRQQQQDPNERAMQEMMEMVLKEHPHIHVRRGNEEMPPPLIVTCKFCRHKNGMDTPEDANAKLAEKEEGTSGTAMAPDEKKEEGIKEKEEK